MLRHLQIQAQVQYEATATDQTSGKVGGSLGDHYDSASGAGGHAVYDLFNNKLTSTLTTDDCSCQGQTLPVGKCVFKGSICGKPRHSPPAATMRGRV